MEWSILPARPQMYSCSWLLRHYFAASLFIASSSSLLMVVFAYTYMEEAFVIVDFFISWDGRSSMSLCVTSG